jgi:tRNA pseudouridine38-40 synthase
VRYFIRLSFHGADFHGWQIQENANSVQAELNRALSLLLREEVQTTGCGRTDTGVHARTFFAHFDTNLTFDLSQLVYQVNALLPFSIAVHSVFPVGETDHARFTALERSYEYLIHGEKNPFLNGTSWYYPHQPDIIKMNSLAVLLTEYTDFSAFSKSNTQTFTNNCRITFAEWKIKDDQLMFKITADRFLRNMVRAIVGTLLKAGAGQMDEPMFRSILESRSRSNAGTSVPAHGLFLTEIKYPFPTE